MRAGFPPVKESPGEFQLIARLCRGLRAGRRTVLGPGDDCAIVAPSRRPQLLTIDSVVEGVHCNLSWGTPELLGARSLMVNLSDIAAMGGAPTACVVNLAIGPRLGSGFFDRLYAGLRGAAKTAGVDVVGGNITRASEFSITIALMGELRAGALRRDAARPGDEIFVTGTLGDAAVGWRILGGKLKAAGAHRRYLTGRYLSPTARLEAGQRLARIRPAPAAIDLSDGLVQDLGHILERSGVGAEIDAEAVPLSAAYRAVMGADRALALGGGEDYELLFCLRPGHAPAQLERRLGLPVHRLGRIVAGKRMLLREGGRASSLPPGLGGWDQLRSRD